MVYVVTIGNDVEFVADSIDTVFSRLLSKGIDAAFHLSIDWGEFNSVTFGIDTVRTVTKCNIFTV